MPINKKAPQSGAFLLTLTKLRRRLLRATRRVVLGGNRAIASPATISITRPSNCPSLKNLCGAITKSRNNSSSIGGSCTNCHLRHTSISWDSITLSGASQYRRTGSLWVTLTIRKAKGSFTIQNTSFNSSLHRTRFGHYARHLRLRDIGLILRDSNRRQNTDNRNNDHQLNKRKTLLNRFHFIHPIDYLVCLPEFIQNTGWAY